MGDFDYTTGKPQMPQFREDDGSWDWRQIADTVLPGNWWNSRTNQYRPLGIASGLTGLPIEQGVALGRGIGNGVAGASRFMRGIGRGRATEDRTWMGPSGMGPTNVMPSFRGNFADSDVWGTRPVEAPAVDPNWRMPGTGDRRSDRRSNPNDRATSAQNAGLFEMANSVRGRGLRAVGNGRGYASGWDGGGVGGAGDFHTMTVAPRAINLD